MAVFVSNHWLTSGKIWSAAQFSAQDANPSLSHKSSPDGNLKSEEIHL